MSDDSRHIYPRVTSPHYNIAKLDQADPGGIAVSWLQNLDEL